MDMFAVELTEAQADEIEKLKAINTALERDCRKLHMIYKKVWSLIEKVACDGGMEMSAQDKIFEDLYESMANYDGNKDLRDKYSYNNNLAGDLS